MTNSGKRYIPLIITIAIILTSFLVIVSCSDDDDPKNPQETNNTVITGTTTETTTTETTTTTTSTGSGEYDLKVENFKIWGTVNQTAGDFLGGYEDNSNNRENNITGYISNIMNDEAPVVKILVEVMPEGETDWNTYGQIFAEIDSPDTGIPAESKMYIGGEKIFYKIYGFPNGKYNQDVEL